MVRRNRGKTVLNQLQSQAGSCLWKRPHRQAWCPNHRQVLLIQCLKGRLGDSSRHSGVNIVRSVQLPGIGGGSHS